MMAVTAQICLEMLLTLTVGLILGSEAKQHMEFTFILPAGSTECFFQSTTRNDSMEVEYQVNKLYYKQNFLFFTYCL